MNAFTTVFTRDIRDRLHEQALAPRASLHVLVIDRLLNGDHRAWKDWRVHARAWLDFGDRHGGLDNDRAARLRRTDDWFAWNQVLNEFRVPYFLWRAYGFEVEYVRPQQGVRTPDLRATKGELRLAVEVKTPGREGPWPPRRGARLVGADKDTLRRCIGYANRQFLPEENNLLVVGAQLLEVRLVLNDTFVKQAIYGEDVIRGWTDLDSGRGACWNQFVPNGRLRPARFTRVSAVMLFDDSYSVLVPHFLHGQEAPHQYHVSVYHNPYSQRPLSKQVFDGTRQMAFDDNGCGYYECPAGLTYSWGQADLAG